VVYREALGKFVGNLVHEGVAGIARGRNQVNGQSAFGGAYAPDVEVVDRAHTGKAGQIDLNGASVDVRRHCAQGQTQRFAQQAPGARDHDGDDGQTDGRIEPAPAGEQD